MKATIDNWMTTESAQRGDLDEISTVVDTLLGVKSHIKFNRTDSARVEFELGDETYQIGYSDPYLEGGMFWVYRERDGRMDDFAWPDDGDGLVNALSELIDRRREMIDLLPTIDIRVNAVLDCDRPEAELIADAMISAIGFVLAKQQAHGLLGIIDCHNRNLDALVEKADEAKGGQ